jgi:hypothetical protein
MSDKLADDHWLETYKSLILLSVEGFKFCALINGGAAVAILAYLGNIVGKGAAAPDMRYAMAFFLGGLGACGLAMLFAYLTQLELLNERAEMSRSGGGHGRYLYASMVLVLCSLISFSLGSWQAVVGFR